MSGESLPLRATAVPKSTCWHSRVTVYDILEYLAGGMTEQEILDDFPALRLEHIRATLVFAANREKRLAA